MYGLMTFGVPVEAFPINFHGDPPVRITNHAKWIARRKAKDEIIERTGRFDGIDLPMMNDVLLGRGRTFHRYPGTVRMRNMVESNAEQYRNLPPKEKAQIATNVVAAVKQGGGRFLDRRKDGWWVEVEDDAAREKVRSTFRTILSVNAKAEDSASAIIKVVDGAKRFRIVKD
jgi:hypothetical protein